MKTMKKPPIRTSLAAVLAALGATAMMLPAQAQYSPPPASGDASQWEQSRPTGSQGQGMAGPPEGSQQMPQGSDAQGAGMQGSQSGTGMDAQGSAASQWEQSRPTGSQGRGVAGPPEGSQQMPQGSGMQGSQSGAGMGMQGGGAQTAQGVQTDQRPLTRAEVQAETQAWEEAGLLDRMQGEGYSVYMADPEMQRQRDEINAQIRDQRGMNEPPGYGTRDAQGVPEGR